MVDLYASESKRKERKNPKAILKHETNLDVGPMFFYGPFLPIWYYNNLKFWYVDAVCSAAMAVLFVWIPCGIMRTMCGLRTGGWSLPCVMSD
jgi:hypothetical protein